jgi:transposase
VRKQIRYQAKRVKDLDVERLLGLGEVITLTVDVAKGEQLVGFSGTDGEVVALGKWSHPSESREFLGLCERLQGGGRRLIVVLEPSGTYGDWLLSWLWEKGIEVRRVLGKQVHDGAAALDGTTSGHDAKSAVLMAGLHALGASRPWVAPTETSRRLRAVGALHGWYDEECERLRGKLEALMARYWPELQTWLSGRRRSYWRLLEGMGGPKAVSERPEEAQTLMERKGASAAWLAKVEAVLQSANETLGVPALPEEVELVRGLASEYERARKKRDALAGQLKEAMSGSATAELVALLGPAATATLLALNLDPKGFEHPRAFVKALGLGLKEKSSGTVKGRLHITKRGSPRARWLVVLAALRLVRDNPVAAAWYRSKRERDGRRDRAGNGMIGVVAVARKLAQAAWHVARGAPFDATRLFDVTRLGIAPTADEAGIGAGATEQTDAHQTEDRALPRGQASSRAATSRREPGGPGKRRGGARPAVGDQMN